MAQPMLDHIVILVSHSTLLTLPERLQDSFTITPGGEHASGLTSNKLILLADGVYIELIAFHPDVTPDVRSRQRWGASREDTVVDWGYTLAREDDFGGVQRRVSEASGGAGITYSDPVAGGRTRPDGTEVRWSVSTAGDMAGCEVRPGCVPFWCLDRTSRGLRVPYEGGRGTGHPSGVRGVARVVVRVRDPGEMGAVRRVLDAVHGRGGGGDAWRVDVPEGAGERRVRVEVGVGEEGPGIELVLLGSGDGPEMMELLPGLVVRVENR